MRYSTAECDDELISFSRSGAYASITCFYDVPSNVLVGTLFTSDTNEFCSGRSFQVVAGRVAAYDQCRVTSMGACGG